MNRIRRYITDQPEERPGYVLVPPRARVAEPRRQELLARGLCGTQCPTRRRLDLADHSPERHIGGVEAGIQTQLPRCHVAPASAGIPSVARISAMRSAKMRGES